MKLVPRCHDGNDVATRKACNPDGWGRWITPTVILTAFSIAGSIDLRAEEPVKQTHSIQSLEVQLTTDNATAKLKRVYVYERGKWRTTVLQCETVHDALDEMEIEHGGRDIITPALESKLGPKTKIRVFHVEVRERTTTRVIPFRTELKHDASLRGRTRIERPGTPGRLEMTVEETLRDGKVMKTRVVNKKVVVPPTTQLVAVGRREILASRGLTTRLVLTMIATGYSTDPRECPRSSKGRTANGMRAGYGLVAVDPRVIKLGTRLYIEGYGYALAADKGSAIKGMRIDLCQDNHREAQKVGRRKVRVHILE